MLALRPQQSWDIASPFHTFNEPRELPPRLSHAGMEAAALLASLHNAEQPRASERPSQEGVRPGFSVESEPLAVDLSEKPTGQLQAKRRKEALRVSLSGFRFSVLEARTIPGREYDSPETTCRK
jgi:hypothetical protein